MKTKYIFVTGGVCSSLGKGITAASIGALLKACGLKVFTMKLDPYLNVDPGTMSPFQHGEVFVTDDGAETDLDLGHYERFIGESLSQLSNVTTGSIYDEIIKKERKGEFLGKTIQIIPHITNAIKQRIITAGKKHKADIVMVEIGGTVGDIEGLPYLEAIRQMRYDTGSENTLYVHVTLVPYLQASKELKTKPTQASVRELRNIGIQPDFLIPRSDFPMKKELLEKIALFCDVKPEEVIPAVTCESIYQVPLNLEKYKIAEQILKKLNINKKLNSQEWEELGKKIDESKETLKIALVGKYTHLEDAYISVIESLKIACYHNNKKLELLWIDSEELEEDNKKTWERLKSVAGIVIPGGFGTRGMQGKIEAAKYARENRIPYLGLCLGMQIMTIEFVRNVLKKKSATSEEFDEEKRIPKKYYVIHFLPGQHKERDKGGTLRLGSYPCHLVKGTKTHALYGTDKIDERHRHRFEFNNAYKKLIEEAGLIVSGEYQKGNLVEMVELKNHPFMIGCQFHPEFLSRPQKPHPLFREFIKASIKNVKI